MPPDKTGKSEKDRWREVRRNIRIYKQYVEKRAEIKRTEERVRRPRLIEQTKWRSVEIDFVGISDCVESMANNSWRLLLKQSLKEGDYQDHKFYNYDLPENVKLGYHAMALDETRGMYEVIKWVHPDKPRSDQVLEQVWFSGGHGDVGGGYDRSQSLAGIALNWMLTKLESSGLIPGDLKVHEDMDTPPTDTGAFFLAGKALGRLRENQVRNRSFWFDRRVNPDNPGSQEEAFDMVTTKPLVHESVLVRMIKAFSTESIGGAPQFQPYRPKQFQIGVDEAFEIRPAKNETRMWPQQSLPFYHAGRVDFERLRREIRVVGDHSSR